MKVLNLRCQQQHVFEGWFASEDDHRDQSEKGLLSCPVCGDASVQKMPSAPRLHLGSTTREPSEATTGAMPVAVPGGSVPSVPDLPAPLVQALRELMKATEDVGERFADQARAMHYGDLEQRNIRGRTSPEVALALVEEGIDILPLPSLPTPKQHLH